jgi:uncharacterized zinc-type alcohol dehydrogenase-like protein
MNQTKAYAAASATAPLAATSIQRRATTPRDVQIEILFCGICHSDLHAVRDEWSSVMPTIYPIVPGHEIVGRVTAVGAKVTKFKTGDLVGVGCIVDSDHDCPSCEAHVEQFCPDATFTYNSPDKHGTATVTYGGYSESIVVDEKSVLRVRTTSISPGWRRCSAPASSPGRRSAAGATSKGRRSAWSASVASATWE